MKKISLETDIISAIEYEKINELTKIEDDNINVNTIINACEYLKNKKIVAPYKINYPRDKFIYNMINRVSVSPDYTPAVIEFLESNYFSSLMKKSLYTLTSTIPNCERINVLLQSDLPMNEFPVSQISEIRSILVDYILRSQEISEYSYNSYIILSHIFDEYMFILDGIGPVNYIKSHEDKNGLARKILFNSGLAQKRLMSFNRVDPAYFNEKHLLSIYNKIKKYIPEASDEFIILVECMKKLSPADFINSFYEFVDNNYTCDNLDMFDDNICFDEMSNYDSSEQALIKEKFLEIVDGKQKVLRLTNNID